MHLMTHYWKAKAERAYAEGREAAFTGGSNPHESGSDAHTAWNTGFAATGVDTTARSGTAADPYTFVRFGEDGIVDRISLPTAAGVPIATTDQVRAIIRGRFTLAPEVTGSDTLLHIGTGTATQHLRIQRFSSNSRLAMQVGASASVTSAAQYRTGTEISATDVVTLLISFNGDHPDPTARGSMTIFVNGALFEEVLVTGAGTSCSFSTDTELSIGSVISSWTSANTHIFRGKLAAIRAWFGAAATPIFFRNAQSMQPIVTAPVVASTVIPLQYTYGIVAGDVLQFNATPGTPTRTVASVDSATQVTVTAPISLTGPGVDDDVAFYTSSVRDRTTALAVPAALGAIQGQQPGVYFGYQQTLANWNAGTSLGTFSSGWSSPNTLTAG